MSVYPALGLYWFANVDPTVGAGVAAPYGQLLIRTDIAAIYWKSGSANTAWTLIGNGSGATANFFRGSGLFGDGSDGDLVVAGTYVATRDMAFNNLTIPAGQRYHANGWRVFVRGLLSIGGSLDNNGNNAFASSPTARNNPGAATGTGTCPIGAAGGVGQGLAGGAGNGGASSALPNAGYYTGGVGGTAGGSGSGAGGNSPRPAAGGGGGGAPVNVGAAGGGATLTTLANGNPSVPPQNQTLRIITGGTLYSAGAGGGGGGQGSDSVGVASGGGGGGGGGGLVVNAMEVEGAGEIACRGGNGFSPFADTGVNSGGGGAGGGGLLSITVGRGTPNYSVAPGTPGVGVAGNNGGTAGAGFAIVNNISNP